VTFCGSSAGVAPVVSVDGRMTTTTVGE